MIHDRHAVSSATSGAPLGHMRPVLARWLCLDAFCSCQAGYWLKHPCNGAHCCESTLYLQGTTTLTLNQPLGNTHLGVDVEYSGDTRGHVLGMRAEVRVLLEAYLACKDAGHRAIHGGAKTLSSARPNPGATRSMCSFLLHPHWLPSHPPPTLLPTHRSAVCHATW